MKTVSIPTCPNPHRIIITGEVPTNTYLLTYLFTYSLTRSMQHRPEANQLSSSQEITHILHKTSLALCYTQWTATWCTGVEL
jgi:hypothetical protein